jgi:hypothetical protein
MSRPVKVSIELIIQPRRTVPRSSFWPARDRRQGRLPDTEAGTVHPGRGARDLRVRGGAIAAMQSVLKLAPVAEVGDCWVPQAKQ